jgi:hypothetical protein
MSKADYFLKNTLGEDFLESLSKTEIWKPGSKSVNDVDDMWHGLKLVPRTVISFLVKELSGMQVGENKRVELPVAPNSFMIVTKHERDQFSGDIEQDNKKVTEFKFRSLPGIGLVLMSAFELYDEYLLEESQAKAVPSPAQTPQPIPEIDDTDSKIQKLIDERLMLHDLIGQVVDKKMMHKEAVHQLVLAKLTEAIKLVNEKANQAHERATEANSKATVAVVGAEAARNIVEKSVKKPKPLQSFLDKKKQKVFSIPLHMTKGESIGCPDCGKNIFDGTSLSPCICYGDSGKIFIKKTEHGIKVKFSKNWETDNIEMLLELLKKKNRNA